MFNGRQPYVYGRLLRVCAACVFTIALTAHCMLPDYRRPLNDAELQVFIRDYSGFTTLLVEDVNNATTVWVYESSQDKGCFLLWGGLHGISGYTRATSLDVFPKHNPFVDPVTVVYGKGYQNEVVCVIINDADLARQAASIAVTFRDGQTREEAVDSQTAFVFGHRGASRSYRNVTLYDANQRTLFRFCSHRDDICVPVRHASP